MHTYSITWRLNYDLGHCEKNHNDVDFHLHHVPRYQSKMTAESLTRSKTCDHRAVSSFVHLRARPFLWGKQRTLYSFVHSVGRRRHGGDGVHTHHRTQHCRPFGDDECCLKFNWGDDGKVRRGPVGECEGMERERGGGKGEVRLKG